MSDTIFSPVITRAVDVLTRLRRQRANA